MPKEKEELKLEKKQEEKKTNLKKTNKATKASTKKTSSKKETVKKQEEKKRTSTTSKKKTTQKSSTEKKSTKPETKAKSNSSNSTSPTPKTTPSKYSEKADIHEQTVIEKIKSFIAKIIAMQEEAEKEEQEEKENKTKKDKKTKTDTQKRSKKDSSTPVYLAEYYDLPYRYNETVVKILAQTPKRIFVYWDIADADIERYRKAFGEDFFEKTYPVLLVHNVDKNTTIEIPVNDFANSWYIDVQDTKTKYELQLGRKFKTLPDVDEEKIKRENIILHTDYLPIANSNGLEVPNDHVLWETLPSKIKFRNVKTYQEEEISLSALKTQYGNIYDLQAFYKEMYQEEITDGILDFQNPTSGGLTSSAFK